MKLRDCFTIDLRARTAKRYSLLFVLGRLVNNPGYRAVVYYRIAAYLREIRFPHRLSNVLSSLILMRLNRVPGVEIRTEYEVGEGLVIYHAHDIVLGRGCRIGRNVTIYNGVTLGARAQGTIGKGEEPSTGYPTIEDGVVIFSGAKLIGPITIGRDSVVGANSVVMTSFPENSVIVGIPARAVQDREPHLQNTADRER